VAYIGSVIAGVLTGIATWLLDAVFFAYYTVDSTMMGALFTDVPTYRIAIRVFLLALMLFWGCARAYKRWYEEREFFGLTTAKQKRPVRTKPVSPRFSWSRKETAKEEINADCTAQSQRLWDYAAMLCEGMHLEPCRMAEVRTLCWTHYIGFIGVGSEKNSENNEHDENNENRISADDHSEIGASIMECVPGLESCARLLYCHHERWDGSGLHGIAEDEIPLGCRIFSVVWVYDALRTRRHLRNEDALRILYDYRGTALDPALVDSFIKMMSHGRLKVIVSGQREAVWY